MLPVTALPPPASPMALLTAAATGPCRTPPASTARHSQHHGTPGAEDGASHLMRSCFSVERFCELGVYWSKSHSAASEAGEEIKIWAVLASSQTSGCTHHCLGLRLRSSPAWPPAPTCATERGEEGGGEDGEHLHYGIPAQLPQRDAAPGKALHSRPELQPVGFSSPPVTSCSGGSSGVTSMLFYCFELPCA